MELCERKMEASLELFYSKNDFKAALEVLPKASNPKSARK